MRHKRLAGKSLASWMALHPFTAEGRTLMAEEKSVFHPTESRHD
jgi:hypothetical protein